jgi:hypothetical protein
VSSKPLRRAFGLKVRFIMAMVLVRKVSTRRRFRCTGGKPESSQTQRTFVALSSVTRRLAAMKVLSRGAAQAHHNNTSRSGFRNSHGVFRGLAHAAHHNNRSDACAGAVGMRVRFGVCLPVYK